MSAGAVAGAPCWSGVWGLGMVDAPPYTSERVPLAALEIEGGVNYDRYITAEGEVPKRSEYGGEQRRDGNYAEVSEHLVNRAAREADEAGQLWTPLINKLDKVQPDTYRTVHPMPGGGWSQANYFNSHRIAKPRLARMEKWVARQTDPRQIEPLLDFRNQRIDEIVATHTRAWDDALLARLRKSGLHSRAALAKNPHLPAGVPKQIALEAFGRIEVELDREVDWAARKVQTQGRPLDQPPKDRGGVHVKVPDDLAEFTRAPKIPREADILVALVEAGGALPPERAEWLAGAALDSGHGWVGAHLAQALLRIPGAAGPATMRGLWDRYGDVYGKELRSTLIANPQAPVDLVVSAFAGATSADDLEDVRNFASIPRLRRDPRARRMLVDIDDAVVAESMLDDPEIVDDLLELVEITHRKRIILRLLAPHVAGDPEVARWLLDQEELRTPRGLLTTVYESVPDEMRAEVFDGIARKAPLVAVGILEAGRHTECLSVNNLTPLFLAGSQDVRERAMALLPEFKGGEKPEGSGPERTARIVPS